MLDLAISRVPNDPVLFGERGGTHLILGLFDAAVADFSTAIALGDENPDFYFARAVSLAEIGRTEEAVADLRTAQALGPTPGTATEIERLLTSLNAITP